MNERRKRDPGGLLSNIFEYAFYFKSAWGFLSIFENSSDRNMHIPVW